MENEGFAFTSLTSTKHAQNTIFPLPHIDLTVDATVGYEMLSFMDVYSSYNKILMHPNNQKRTAFITKTGSTAIR